jgi:hypothetical protein
MKRDFFIYLILILILLIIIPIVLSSSLNVDRPWPSQYNRLDIVNITGSGFEPYEDSVTIEIWDQHSRLMGQIDVIPNGTGDFITSYIIPEWAYAERHDVYAIRRPPLPRPQINFTVLVDTERPRWNYFDINPKVVTILDNVEINATWSDNLRLNKVLIWENSTRNWVVHVVSA